MKLSQFTAIFVVNFKITGIQRNLNVQLKKVVDKYISGTTVIKKANFEDHMKKNETHCIASLCLLEKQYMTAKTNKDKSTNSVPVCLTFKNLQQ